MGLSTTHLEGRDRSAWRKPWSWNWVQERERDLVLSSPTNNAQQLTCRWRRRRWRNHQVTSEVDVERRCLPWPGLHCRLHVDVRMQGDIVESDGRLQCTSIVKTCHGEVCDLKICNLQLGASLDLEKRIHFGDGKRGILKRRQNR